jgi:adenylylsulfate reductase subunit A
VGGHTASGYWVDTNRATTIDGLFAAGDVAGGCPQKYVTGALAEGEIAALSAVDFVKGKKRLAIGKKSVEGHINEIERFLSDTPAQFTTEQLEEAMQTVMDSYAGGIKTNYRFNEKQLDIADEKIVQLIELSDSLRADDFQELMYIYELRERLTVCRSVIAHLKARHETRWHSFAENLDYPQKDDENWRVYVNSRLENGEIKIILRDLTEGGQTYEHSDQ